MTATTSVPSLFSEIHGCQLSAVTFVQDYLQLWFDGPGINVMNPLTVKTSNAAVTSWQPGFRDLLCGQITKVITTVDRSDGEALLITFEDSSSLSISLRAEDYDTAEAYYAHGFKGGASCVE